jgi:F0F1-type ATP synthase membrane subunit b/b'
MPTNPFDPTHEVVQRSPKSHTAIIAGLAAGLVIALACDGYLVMRSNDLQQDVAKAEANAQTQISKLSEATTARIDEQQKQWDDVVSQKVKGVNDSAAAAIRRARVEADKKSEELSRQIADTHTAVSNELNTELSALKDTTTSKFTEVSTDVDHVKANVETVKSSVAATQTQLDGTSADLKRVVGDMGVMSGLIATNSKDLDALRALGDRNYFEFDLSKGQTSKKVGDVTLTLRKADIKRNRYTVDILADDKHVEKKDKTINEPVQLYVGGNGQPYEVVVNQVKKDEILGYLATPKMKIARR